MIDTEMCPCPLFAYRAKKCSHPNNLVCFEFWGLVGRGCSWILIVALRLSEVAGTTFLIR